MKILMTSDTFLPLVGGGEIHVKELCEGLVTLGHEIVLVTNQLGKSGEEFPYKVERIAWSKKNLFKLFGLLWKEAGESDLIHAHYSYRLSALAALVGNLRGKPVVMTLHGLGTLDEPGARFPYKQVHALYRFLALNLATKIISTSEDIAKVARLHMIVPNNIEIIFNGLDTRIFNESVPLPAELGEKYRDQKILLSVRRLVPKNGIHFMVESMPDLIKLVPNVKYLMIGVGRMAEHIKGRIKDLGIEAQVEMLGEIPNNRIPSYLKLADVVVFPSTAESSSIACAEAMTMGKSIVSSRVGGLVELLGQNNERGSLVKLVDWEGSDYAAPVSLPADRYESLAKAIAGVMLSDDSVRQKAAAEYAKQELDWRVVTAKTVRLYEKLKK